MSGEESFLPELVKPRVLAKPAVEQSGVIEPSCGVRGSSEARQKCLNLPGLGMPHHCW